METNTIEFSLEDGVATATLNRLDSDVNALNGEMAHDLFDICSRCGAADVRAVVFAAKGKVFCGGGDLNEMLDEPDPENYLTKTATIFHAAIARLAHINAPVVMAVDGSVGGAGLSIVASGDFVVASEDVKFVSAYTGAGLTPDGSASYYLAKHIGLMRAKELFLTNRTLDAKEAENWGLVNRVVPRDAVKSEAMRMAKTFAAGATEAFGSVKSLLNSSYYNGLETQLDREARSIGKAIVRPDAQKRIAAFLSK